MRISSAAIGLVAALVLVPVRVHQQGAFRTITIDTAEVTTPAMAATPDGRALVFSALGHLYELPVAGGAATQLTFGPSVPLRPGDVARWRSRGVRVESRWQRIQHLRAGSSEQARHAGVEGSGSSQTGLESGREDDRVRTERRPRRSFDGAHARLRRQRAPRDPHRVCGGRTAGGCRDADHPRVALLSA